MQKHLPLLLSFLVIVLSIYFVYMFSISIESKYLTNSTELFSLFTPYMEDNVRYKLSTVDCSLTKYYYTDSNVCFNCEEFDACFGYGWVNRVDGQRMNPSGDIFLTGDYDEDVLLNFESFGVSKWLNCNCEYECLCDNGIKAEYDSERVSFVFPENMNITEKLEEIIADTEYECEIKNIVLSCKNFDGLLIENKLII